MVNTHAKFEVSTLNRSWDMEGSQNSKSRSRDPFRPHWAYFWILFFLCSSWSTFVPNLKFLPWTVPKILSESQNSKNRLHDPSPTPFDLLLNFHRCYPLWSICVPNLKFLVWTVPDIWRRSQNFKSRPCDLSPTPFDLLLNWPWPLTHDPDP